MLTDKIENSTEEESVIELINLLKTEWNNVVETVGSNYERLHVSRTFLEAYQDSKESFVRVLNDLGTRINAVSPTSLENAVADLKLLRTEVLQNFQAYEDTRSLLEKFTLSCDIDREFYDEETEELKQIGSI